MSNSAIGVAGMVAFGLLMLSWLLGMRRRPADKVVTQGSAGGQQGLAIHPWRGHRSGIVAAWAIAVAVTALGLWSLHPSPVAGCSSPRLASTSCT